MQVSTCWTKGLPLGESLKALERIAAVLAKRAGTRGVLLYGHIQRQEWTEVLNYEVVYHDDDEVGELIALRQLLALYQKLEPLEVPGIDKERVAFDTWASAEDGCFETNCFFRSLDNGTVHMVPRDAVVFDRARRILSRLLGAAPRICELKPRFGPGSTSTVRRQCSTAPFKLGERPSCSVDLLNSQYRSEFFNWSPHWLACHEDSSYIDEDGWEVAKVTVDISTGTLEFVPKSAKTYRSIDKQPTLNTVWQAAVGDYMTARLGKRGINLRDQSINNSRAAIGSIDGSTATIDLSSASDLISYELVKSLVPEDWFRLLRSLRTSTTSYKGKEYRLNKFSAMGNGFTFPLQSAIFYALSLASLPADATNRCVTVFGDDIVIPCEHYDAVARTLELCGFRVNETKSFKSGPFRESCGKDYFKGINIRPYYQKDLVSGKTLFTMHNFFFANYDEELCAIVKALVPTPLRLYGPAGCGVNRYGDGHLHSLEWPFMAARRGWGGVFFNTYSTIGDCVTSPYYGDYVSPLYVTYIQESSPSDERQGMEFLRDGRPLWPVPSRGAAYEVKRIYTFARPTIGCAR